jgi:hypothetical protein
MCETPTRNFSFKFSHWNAYEKSNLQENLYVGHKEHSLGQSPK